MLAPTDDHNLTDLLRFSTVLPYEYNDVGSLHSCRGNVFGMSSFHNRSWRSGFLEMTLCVSLHWICHSQIIWCTYGVSLVFLILSIMSVSKKYDVTRWCGILVIILVLVTVCGLFVLVEPSKILYFLYCALAVMPFPMWALFDIYLIFDRKRRKIKIKDYCYAALQVHVDLPYLVYSFCLYICQLCCKRRQSVKDMSWSVNRLMFEFKIR